MLERMANQAAEHRFGVLFGQRGPAIYGPFTNLRMSWWILPPSVSST